MKIIQSLQLELKENDPSWQYLCQKELISGLRFAFEGDLGSGKSSLIRHFLRLMGVEGTIRSPTYTLCESYEPDGYGQILHIDAYRIKSADDWEMLGLDLFDEATSSLWIEWCSLHPSYFSLSDVSILIHMCQETSVRLYDIRSYSVRGHAWLAEAARVFHASLATSALN